MVLAAWQLEIHLRKLKEELEQAQADGLPQKRISTLERMARRMAKRVAKATDREQAARQKARERARTPRKRQTDKTKAQRSPLKPRKRLPPRNEARARRMSELRFGHSIGYSEHIRGLACIWCGTAPTEDQPSQCMHVKGVDLGGTAQDILPGCWKCHGWQETHKRQFEEEFTERHGMTPLEMAHALHAAFLLEKGEQA